MHWDTVGRMRMGMLLRSGMEGGKEGGKEGGREEVC